MWVSLEYIKNIEELFKNLFCAYIYLWKIFKKISSTLKNIIINIRNIILREKVFEKISEFLKLQQMLF